MLLDLHSHTSWSPDAEDSALQLCLRAQELGLRRLAITDHCDCNFWLPADEGDYPECQLCDSMMFGSRSYAQKSIEEVSRLKERFPFLICGIELGQPMQAPEAAAEITSRPELDFVIGSHHMNRGQADFYWLKYGEMGDDEIHGVLERCFSETLEMCREADFDVLGHLTYPLRYIIGDSGIGIDMGKYEEVIREIFRTLIGRGKGIEINTSGLRQKIAEALPSLEYVKLYRELGGELLTIGSDAHRAADLGAGIREGEEIAKAAGFDKLTYFIGRKPEYIKI